jgi:SAM-dependent methyltransferase
MNCRICDEAGAHARYRAREMFFGTGETFDYFQCRRCGCLQIADIPADLGRYYRADYYSLAPAGTRQPSRVAVRKRLQSHLLLVDRTPVGRAAAALARRVFPDAYPVQFMPQIRDGGLAALDEPILDVGCGSGQFLLALAGLGFTRLDGCDPFIAADVAVGPVALHRADIGDLPGERRYKLILFQHSLEHMADPVRALAAARRLLRNDGQIFVEVPVADSYAWEEFGTDWVDLDAPRHLFLPTRAGMARLAADAGLRVSRIAPMSSMFELLGSEQYRRGIPLRSPESFLVRGVGSVYTKAEVERAKTLARTLNVPGRAGRLAFYFRSADTAFGAGPDAAFQ